MRIFNNKRRILAVFNLESIKGKCLITSASQAIVSKHAHFLTLLSFSDLTSLISFLSPLLLCFPLSHSNIFVIPNLITFSYFSLSFSLLFLPSLNTKLCWFSRTTHDWLESANVFLCGQVTQGCPKSALSHGSHRNLMKCTSRINMLGKLWRYETRTAGTSKKGLSE